MEQKLTMRCVRVHPFRQRSERDLSVAQTGDDVEQMRQRAPQAIEFPYDQRIPGLQEVEADIQAGSIITGAGRLVLEQVSGVDAGTNQGVALQRRVLPVIVGRDTHIADKHVWKTLQRTFPSILSFRHGFSYRKIRATDAVIG